MAKDCVLVRCPLMETMIAQRHGTASFLTIAQHVVTSHQKSLQSCAT